jgi:hypothetical protein
MSHSKLAPSAASRWTLCTLSVPLIEREQRNLPPDGSIYSVEGDIAHEWAKKINLGLADISEVPEEDGMREAVKVFTDLCERIQKPGDKVLVEKRVALFYAPKDGGTVDFAALSPDRIYVADYKHGAGVEVRAKENKQAAIYARSLVDEFEDSGLFEWDEETLVTIAIVQPRHHSSTDEPVKLWSLSLKDLKEFTSPIGHIAKVIRGEAPANGVKMVYHPSEETCRFCPAKGLCVARKEQLNEPLPFDVAKAFDDETPCLRTGDNPATLLEPEQVAQIVLNKKEIISWLNDVEEAAQATIESGSADFEGFLKVVRGREGNRSWVDEEAASNLLSKYITANERFTKKLVSPTQAAKMLPKEEERSTRFNNRLEELISRPSGKPCLVPWTDKRESIVAKAEDHFDNEEADSNGLD